MSSMFSRSADLESSSVTDNETDDDADLLVEMRQLKHQHDSLLREKRQMQEYMSEVEADAHEKDQRLSQLNEALTRERVQANLAGQQVSELERRLSETAQKEQDAAPRRRRKLPGAPGFRSSIEDHEAQVAASTKDQASVNQRESIVVIEGLREDIRQLEDALSESRELLKDRRTDHEGEFGPGGLGNEVNLADELKTAFNEVDEVALLEMATRFNEMNEQLAASEEAMLALRDELDQMVEMNEELNGELHVTRQEADTATSRALALQDALDEAHLQLQDATRPSTDSPATVQPIDTSLNDSLASEMVGDKLKELTKETAALEAARKRVELSNKELMEKYSAALEAKTALLSQLAAKDRALEEASLASGAAAHASQAELRALTGKLDDVRAELASAEQLHAAAQQASTEDLRAAKARFEADINAHEDRASKSKGDLESDLQGLIGELEAERQAQADILSNTQDTLRQERQTGTELKLKIAELESAATESAESIAYYTEQARVSEGRLSKLDQDHHKMEVHLDDVTMQYKKATNELDTLRGVIETLKEHNSKYSEHVKSAHDESRKLAADNSALQEDLRKAQAALADSQQAVAETEDHSEQKRLKLVAMLTQKEESAKHAEISFSKSLAANKEQIAALTSQLRDAHMTTDLIKSDVLRGKADLEAVRAKAKAADERAAAELAALREESQAEADRLLQDLQTMSTRLAGVSQELEQSADSREAAESKADHLETLLEQAKKQRQLTIDSLKLDEEVGIKAVQDELAVLHTALDASDMSASIESGSKLDALVVKVHDAHESEISSYESKMADLELALKLSEEELEMLKEDEDQKAELVERMQQQDVRQLEHISELNNKLATAQENLKRTAADLESLRKMIANGEEVQGTLEAETAAANAEIDRLKDTAESAARALADYITKNAALDETKSTLERENLDLKNDKADLIKSAAQWEATVAKQESGVQRLRDDLVAQTDVAAAARITLEQRQRELAELREAYEILGERTSAIKDEHDQLLKAQTDAAESLEGELKDTKRLLEQAKLDREASAVAEVQREQDATLIAKLTGERAQLSQELAAMQSKAGGLSREFDSQTAENARLGSDNKRLKENINKAGENVKLYIEQQESAAKEMLVLQRKFEEAELNGKRLKMMLEQGNDTNKKRLKRVIEKADFEFAKLKKRMAEMHSQMRHMCPMPHLGGLFGIVAQLSGDVEERTGAPPGGPPEGIESPHPQNQINAVETQLKYIQTLIGRIDASAGAGDCRPAPVAKRREIRRPKPRLTVGPPRIKKEQPEGDGAVDRLLSAVKNFYAAKNKAKGNAAADAGSSAVPPPAMAAVQQVVQQTHPTQEPTAVGSPTMNFDPVAHPDEMEAPEQPSRPLSENEQDSLFQDWVRLKDKVKALVKQLVSAKAAIAAIQYREQQDHVYMGNRDRLIAKLVDKCGGKRKKITQLQDILLESSQVFNAAKGGPRS